MLAAGDGICFLTDRGFAGTNVNAADGDCVTPNRMEGIVPGTEVYRNYDHRFNQLLARSRTRRVIPASVLVEATAGGRLRPHAASPWKGLKMPRPIPRHCGRRR